MGEERIKRIDRVGNTEGIPYTRTVRDFKSQRWIANRFYRLMGRSAFFWKNPEEGLGVGTFRGANFFDLKDTAGWIKSLEKYPKENIRSGRRLEGLARREEEAGHAQDFRIPLEPIVWASSGKPIS